MTNEEKEKQEVSEKERGGDITPATQEVRRIGDEGEYTSVAPSGLSTEQMKQVMEEESERRALIKDYIDEHLVEGTDYGAIHFSKNCKHKWNPENCNNESHWSKDTLFKPGAEKFVSLFKLTPTFKKDTETLEMMDNEKNVFAYVCYLRNNKGQIVGEGRGAAQLSERENWTINNAIKIAQKRAQVDAVLRTGALSDFFTQDLEDMNKKEKETEEERVERMKRGAQDVIENKISKEEDIDKLQKFMSDVNESEKYPEEVKDMLIEAGTSRIKQLQDNDIEM